MVFIMLSHLPHEAFEPDMSLYTLNNSDIDINLFLALSGSNTVTEESMAQSWTAVLFLKLSYLTRGMLSSVYNM